MVFCDTDRVPAIETKQGERTTNDIEAALIKQVLHADEHCTKVRLWMRFAKEEFLHHQ